MKKIIMISLLLLAERTAMSQKINWQNGDLQKDSVFGISLSRAYHELLMNKHSERVIVGIIDSGVDTAHEDLKGVLWADADGSHGWNYIADETGQEDITRIISEKKEFYDSLQYTLVPEMYRSGYKAYRKWSPALAEKIKAMKDLIKELETNKRTIDEILTRMGKPAPSAEELKNYHPENKEEEGVVKLVLRRLHLYSGWQTYREAEIDQIIKRARFHLEHGLNLHNQEADTAKGDRNVFPDALGLVANPNVTAYHGTHVAGIIGAVRNNGIGLDGIADNVRLLVLKDNGNIREMRNDCLARAIRFGVDHGARVINMSFGKPYSWNRKVVDEAVKYAMQKDVLLVHGAGNNGEDLDGKDFFPNPVYADNSGIAKAWIEVGASGLRDDSTLIAEFSNYGKKSVDIFAPGVQIYSTLPYNQYQAWDGTSMAAPVVSGVAALIREYYPKLTAIQVKDIIMKSVVKRDILKDKCISGGVVNAYNALKLASTYK